MKTALVLACDDNFIAYASVVARRAEMLASDNFPIIIVSDGVTDENKKLAQKFCPRISFIEGSHLLEDKAFYTRTTFTRAAYLRLFFDEILADFDRVAYVDCDVSPLVNLGGLVDLRPKSSPIMGTYDLCQLYDGYVHDRLPLSKQAGYMQSGVLVFDLNATRSEGILKDALRFALESPELCHLVEQDALNVVLQGRWQVLDWRWNVLHFQSDKMPRPHFLRHLTGAKPWSPNKVGIEQAIKTQWRDDLAESPWPLKYLAEVPQPKPRFSQLVRPFTRAIEDPLRSMLGRESKKPLPNLRRYLRNLPSILQQAEARAGQQGLGAALGYP